jgi:DNA-binding MarR family transcriptional regulator
MASSNNAAVRSLRATGELLGFGFLIGAVSRSHADCLDRVLKPMGLTHAQSTLLLMLADAGENSSQSEIAVAFDLGKSTVVGMIDRLEAKSYVYRELTSTDRRLKRVVVTE